MQLDPGAQVRFSGPGVPSGCFWALHPLGDSILIQGFSSVAQWLHRLQPQSAPCVQIQQEREWLASFPVVPKVSWYFVDSNLVPEDHGE